MTVSLKRVIDRLLEADAKVEGHRHVTRFAAEFAQNPAMFHAIFAACVDDKLAGVGAITDEPTLTSQTKWRMRRLYVRREFRRRNVARTIAMELLREAAGKIPAVTGVGLAWSHETTISGATVAPLKARRSRPRMWGAVWAPSVWFFLLR